MTRTFSLAAAALAAAALVSLAALFTGEGAAAEKRASCAQALCGLVIF